jgi:hypothetical protein
MTDATLTVLSFVGLVVALLMGWEDRDNDTGD